MKSRLFLLCLMAASSFLIQSCDKLCKKTVQDLATVQNMTGRKLSLSVCKDSSSVTTLPNVALNIDILSDNLENHVSLGSHELSEIHGGLGVGESCSSTDGGQKQSGFTLSTQSYGTVILCYDDASKKYVITETNQSCPSGFLVQSSAGTCNIH